MAALLTPDVMTLLVCCLDKSLLLHGWRTGWAVACRAAVLMTAFDTADEWRGPANCAQEVRLVLAAPHAQKSVRC